MAIDAMIDSGVITAASFRALQARLKKPLEPETHPGLLPVKEPGTAPEKKPSSADSSDVLGPLVERFSGTAKLLKSIKPAEDPFSKTPSGISDEPTAIDNQSGEVARALLDIMSAPSGASQPQERALAADTLLHLVPRLPFRNLAGLVERVSLMEAPPQLLVRRLTRDPRIEVAGPLIERGSAISDQDLMAVIADGDAAKQRLIARRRTISPVLAAALLDTGDAAVLLALVRNPGASFAIEAFHRLGQLAAEMPALQAPLVTRYDTPAPVAFELFWSLPAQLRRYVLSRFLTDSETLDRILKLALAAEGAEPSQQGASQSKFPERAKVDAFLELAEAGDLDAAGQFLAGMAQLSEKTANRIMADREGEPMTVALKVLGITRAHFEEVIDRFRKPQHGLLRADRSKSDLQSIFDSLSFNKARMLLTYWDWAVQLTGPYIRTGK